MPITKENQKKYLLLQLKEVANSNYQQLLVTSYSGFSCILAVYLLTTYLVLLWTNWFSDQILVELVTAITYSQTIIPRHVIQGSVHNCNLLIIVTNVIWSQSCHCTLWLKKVEVVYLSTVHTCAQCPTVKLNKRSLPKPKTTTG